MSAFVVDHKTIDRILSFLFFNSKSTYFSNDYADEKKLTETGRKLLKMNIKAVNYRYDEKRNFDYAERYDAKISPVSVLQALKSLQCLLYQCSEGKIPRMKLYKEFREIERRILHFIIDEMPGYKKAEWN